MIKKALTTSLPSELSQVTEGDRVRKGERTEAFSSSITSLRAQKLRPLLALFPPFLVESPDE